MRKIREMPRLKFEVGLSAWQVAISLQVGRASIGEYLNRFAVSGLTCPLRSLTPSCNGIFFRRHPLPPVINVRYRTGLISTQSCAASA